jgi:hypothetical protein
MRDNRQMVSSLPMEVAESMDLMLPFVITIALAGHLTTLVTSKPRSVAAERIRVESMYASTLVPPEWGQWRSDLTITQTNQGFSDGTRPVDKRLVQALVHAVLAPPVRAFDASRLGITSDQLRAAAGKRISETNLKDFLDQVANPKDLPRILRCLYHDPEDTFTDVIMQVTIELDLRDGHQLTVKGFGQMPFMIPWTINEGGKKVQSWDPAISRALAALLPSNFANRSLISGEKLIDELIDHGMSYRSVLDRQVSCH